MVCKAKSLRIQCPCFALIVVGIHQSSTSKSDLIWILLQSWSFWKIPGVLLEITQGETGRERERESDSQRERKRERNLSFDSLLIWDNLNPALMQIQGCSTTQPGPRTSTTSTRFVVNLKLGWWTRSLSRALLRKFVQLWPLELFVRGYVFT